MLARTRFFLVRFVDLNEGLFLGGYSVFSRNFGISRYFPIYLDYLWEFRENTEKN